MSKFTDAIKEGSINIVTNNVVTMGSTDGTGGATNAMESLLAILLSEKMGIDFKASNGTDESEFSRNMREEIYKNLNDENKNKVLIKFD